MLNMQTKNARSLRHALRANAIFSGLSGLVIVFLHGQVLTWLGISGVNIAFLGIGLVLFSIYLFWMSSREQMDKSMVVGVIGGDWLWVLASAVLLLVQAGAFSTLGMFIVADVAVVVMVFAIWQQRGLSASMRSVESSS